MIRTCSNCGQNNRIPARHLADTGRCGKCQQALPAESRPLSVDSGEFFEVVEGAKVPVFVDFWAAWCGPCRMAAPQVEKLAAEMAGKAIVLKVDTERNPQLAAQFRINGIPNFMVFKDGKPALQQAGLVDHKQMRRWIEQVA